MELGALPDDAEQNLRLKYIEEQIKIHNNHIDNLRLNDTLEPQPN